jgi:hypothetical protein
MLRRSGAPMLTSHGSGEAEIVPDGAGAPEALWLYWARRNLFTEPWVDQHRYAVYFL